jgi:hypothetical protein
MSEIVPPDTKLQKLAADVAKAPHTFPQMIAWSGATLMAIAYYGGIIKMGSALSALRQIIKMVIVET